MSESQPIVKLVREIPAPPGRVFEAWLEPAALRRFMCPMDGASVSKAESEPRVGGKFLVVMRIGGQDLPHHGEYLEIVPHERLVFSWLSHRAGENSRVALTFEPLANGHTRLTLEHRGLAASECDAHEKGWSAILSNLSSETLEA